MNQAEQTNEIQQNERPRASHTVRLIRATVLAVILTVLGAALGFC